MNISFFFRKPSPVFHSIEEQFLTMQKELPENLTYKNIFAKYQSKGFIKRLFTAIQAAFNQGDINHITGDINFAANFLKKKKTVLTIHDIGSVLTGNKLKVLLKRMFWYYIPFRRVKYITVISEFSKKEILEKLKINDAKIKVVPNCCSPQLYDLDEKPFSETPVILQIGTKQNKNLPKVIKAVSSIKCKLLILGKLSDEYINLLKKYKVNYENKENLSFDEVVKLYSFCDIVIFVSLYEGFGVPIIEANAAKRPVITSNLSPMKDVAADAALLVNPNNVNEIQKALLDVINNKELRKQLVKNGIKNAGNYHPKNVALKYAELYKSLNR